MNDTPDAFPTRDAPGLDSTAPHPAWPAVIGVLSVVQAGLAIWMIAAQILLELAGDGPTPWWGPDPYGKLHALAGAILSLTLLIGGILLLLRVPASGNVHKAYSVALLGLLGLAIWEALPHAATGARAPLRGTDVLGLIATVVPLLAYPLFLIVWFSRPSIAEQIQSWKEHPAELAGQK